MDIDCLLGIRFVKLDVGDPVEVLDACDLLDLHGAPIFEGLEAEDFDGQPVASEFAGWALYSTVSLLPFSYTTAVRSGVDCIALENGWDYVIASLGLAGMSWLTDVLSRQTNEAWIVFALDFDAWRDGDGGWASDWSVLGWFDFDRGCVVEFGDE